MLDFLPEASYTSVYLDKQGFLWCDGSAGIFCVNLKKRTFRKIPLPKDKYGNLFFQPRAIYESSKGNLFFGCSNGFIVLNPNDINSSGRLKCVTWSKVEGTKHNGERFTLPIIERLVKMDGDNEETRISFDVVSLSGRDVVCCYRLKEYDNTWIDLKGKREIVLNHLPAGDYELELSVYVDGHENNPSQLCLKLSVASPWWQSWWFISLVVIILVMLSYGLFAWLRHVKTHANALGASNESEKEPPINPFMAQVMSTIDQNYTNPNFSVEDLAKELRVSKSTLIRKLKPLTGLTPAELIGVYRLKKADEMLRTMCMPIKEVSFLTGFSNPYYFSRKYKEYFGYPPSRQKRE